jgi:hypothetical protein
MERGLVRAPSRLHGGCHPSGRRNALIGLPKNGPLSALARGVMRNNRTAPQELRRNDAGCSDRPISRSAERPVDPVQHPGVELDAGGSHVLCHLLGP